MKLPNQLAAPNPAIAFQLHAGHLAVVAWAREQDLPAGLDGPRPSLAGATDGPARCSIAGALGPPPASTNLSCM